ncbi:MAG: DUF2867 domain-containing protein [Micropepsaceae bacterium]
MAETANTVAKCSIPAQSLLDPHAVETAWFRDSWRAPLAHPDISVTDIFFAVFGHRPGWMKFIMVVRNGIASLAGLETPTRSEIMTPAKRTSYHAGEKIGAWPLFALTENELIAGRDNSHLDFRLSVLKENDCVYISTICNVHNRFGKVYLTCVEPFHRWGIRMLIAGAVQSGRL